MIIGIAGQMESGKSAVAEILERQQNFKNIAFADDLKEMCMEVYGMESYHLYTTEGKSVILDNPIYFNFDHADKILEWARTKHGWKITQEHKDKIYKLDGMEMRTPREILQKIGTEVCRYVFGPSYHAKVTFSNIKKNGWKNVVISDVRFLNERETIKCHDGFNVLVKCADQPETINGHASEISLGNVEDYDFVLFNDKKKGLDYLESIVQQMYAVLSREN